jgi:hypothetical protein
VPHLVASGIEAPLGEIFNFSTTPVYTGVDRWLHEILILRLLAMPVNRGSEADTLGRHGRRYAKPAK